MKNNNEILNLFYEWGVWGHLDSKKDIELILLKGHLLLETALEVTLNRNSINVNDNCSFFRKINLFESHIETAKTSKNDIIIFLRHINNLRNQLAHELQVEGLEENLKFLSEEILVKLNGRKFTRYTHRTKIVHSFSTLAINILEIKTVDN